jgi:uncharacterized protein YceH (UPF0502 family)
MLSSEPSAGASGETPSWQPIGSRLRRILGVLMEKAKTTPDAYPMSIAGIVAGANQKSNRYPLMNLTPEQVEDELLVLRKLGAAAEVQGSGRVPRYRHYGHAWLGVKGVEAAVMIELLLRGQQTAGDLRARASRFEPIADLAALQGVIQALVSRRLIITLTPPGRGQLLTHNLYLPDELKALRSKVAEPGYVSETLDESLESHTEAAASTSNAPATSVAPSVATALPIGGTSSHSSAEVRLLQGEVEQLRQTLAALAERVQTLEQAVLG